MGVRVIAMLTHNDKTIPDAQEVFEKNKQTKALCWGFKDIGIDVESSKQLVAKMKQAGKMTFLEPLVETEEECIAAAELAVLCKFEYLVGMAFYEKAADILKAGGVKYFPTCGKRAGLPRMLYGTVESIIADAKRILDYGVDGICLSVYRYKDGSPEDMAHEFVKQVNAPLIIAGGINNETRLDFVKALNPWGFTLGSALFTDDFGAERNPCEKLDYVKEYLN